MAGPFGPSDIRETLAELTVADAPVLSKSRLGQANSLSLLAQTDQLSGKYEAAEHRFGQALSLY